MIRHPRKQRRDPHAAIREKEPNGGVVDLCFADPSDREVIFRGVAGTSSRESCGVAMEIVLRAMYSVPMKATKVYRMPLSQ